MLAYKAWLNKLTKLNNKLEKYKNNKIKLTADELAELQKTRLYYLEHRPPDDNEKVWLNQFNKTNQKIAIYEQGKKRLTSIELSALYENLAKLIRSCPHTEIEIKVGYSHYYEDDYGSLRTLVGTKNNPLMEARCKHCMKVLQTRNSINIIFDKNDKYTVIDTINAETFNKKYKKD